MTNLPNLLPNLDTISLACPTCVNRYRNKKELLHHLRSSSDDLHKTFRYDACTPSIEPTLLAVGILPCPRACGALFDGGANCTSRPLEKHIEQGHSRNPGAAPLPRELDGPFIPTTTTSGTTALLSEAYQAATNPASAPVNSSAIAFCLAIADYTCLHMRTSGMQSTTALPTPSLSTLTPAIQDLLERAHSTRGVLLRDAAQEALLLFPTLVLGPQRLGASSSSVKAEIIARLDLWRRGHIPELTTGAKAQARLRPTITRSKSARAARRVACLIHENQTSWAASLAGSMGIADATLDTLNALPNLFP